MNKQLKVIDPLYEIYLFRNQHVVSSRLIAKALRKRHDHVLRDVKKSLKVSHEFGETFYYDSQGKKQPEYLLTKDGFILLIMNYQGYNDFKRSYIQRFNELEKELRDYKDIRKLGKVTRRSLTDAIKDSGENERMHGHAYSTYTRMIQKKSGIFSKRDQLSARELKIVEAYENIVSGHLALGDMYKNISENMPENRNTLE